MLTSAQVNAGRPFAVGPEAARLALLFNGDAAIIPVQGKRNTCSSRATLKPGIQGNYTGATGIAVCPRPGSTLVMVEYDDPAIRPRLLEVIPRLANSFEQRRGDHGSFGVKLPRPLSAERKSIPWPDGRKGERLSLRTGGDQYQIVAGLHYHEVSRGDWQPSGDIYIHNGQAPITLSEDEAAHLWACLEALGPARPMAAPKRACPGLARPGASPGERTAPTDDDYQRAADNLKRLATWRASNYQEWIAVGRCLYGLGESGLALWDKFSQRCPEKYDPEVCREKWESFKGCKGNLRAITAKANEDDPAGKWTSGPNAHSNVQPPVLESPAAAIQYSDALAGVDQDWPAAPFAPTPNPLSDVEYKFLRELLGESATAVLWGCYTRNLSGETDRQTIARETNLSDATIRRGTDRITMIFCACVDLTLQGGTEHGRQTDRKSPSCPGRPSRTVIIPPREKLHDLLAFERLARSVQEHFPEGQRLAPPFMVSILMDTERDDPSADAHLLDQRYGALLAAQPGFNEALAKVRRDVALLRAQLRVEITTPIEPGEIRNAIDLRARKARGAIQAAPDGVISNAGVARATGLNPSRVGRALATYGVESVENLEHPIVPDNPGSDFYEKGYIVNREKLPDGTYQLTVQHAKKRTVGELPEREKKESTGPKTTRPRTDGTIYPLTWSGWAIEAWWHMACPGGAIPDNREATIEALLSGDAVVTPPLESVPDHIRELEEVLGGVTSEVKEAIP